MSKANRRVPVMSGYVFLLAKIVTSSNIKLFADKSFFENYSLFLTHLDEESAFGTAKIKRLFPTLITEEAPSSNRCVGATLFPFN